MVEGLAPTPFGGLSQWRWLWWCCCRCWPGVRRRPSTARLRCPAHKEAPPSALRPAGSPSSRGLGPLPAKNSGSSPAVTAATRRAGTPPRSPAPARCSRQAKARKSRCRSSTPTCTPACSGYIATVEVTQQFHNPYSSKIEAVYVFPLPHNAAVNEFIMTIGERRIRGIIRERQEAEQIYRDGQAPGLRRLAAHAGAAQHLHAVRGQHRAGQGD